MLIAAWRQAETVSIQFSVTASVAKQFSEQNSIIYIQTEKPFLQNEVYVLNWMKQSKTNANVNHKHFRPWRTLSRRSGKIDCQTTRLNWTELNWTIEKGGGRQMAGDESISKIINREFFAMQCKGASWGRNLRTMSRNIIYDLST